MPILPQGSKWPCRFARWIHETYLNPILATMCRVSHILNNYIQNILQNHNHLQPVPSFSSYIVSSCPLYRHAIVRAWAFSDIFYCLPAEMEVDQSICVPWMWPDDCCNNATWNQQWIIYILYICIWIWFNVSCCIVGFIRIPGHMTTCYQSKPRHSLVAGKAPYGCLHFMNLDWTRRHAILPCQSMSAPS